MPRTRAQSSGVISKFATGSYTGDGAATQAIVGVGFQPKIVWVYARADTQYNPGFKGTVDALRAELGYLTAAAAWIWDLDYIISLDADGFTVGDGSGGLILVNNVFNIADQDYTYVCWG